MRDALKGGVGEEMGSEDEGGSRGEEMGRQVVVGGAKKKKEKEQGKNF